MSEKMKNNNRLTDFVCFGGEDWWYHNRGHIDFQLMKRFAKDRTVLYVNSIVMQKLGILKKKNFRTRLARKLKSILRGLKKTDAGFWVYSPLSLPLHQYKWGRFLNEIIVRLQIKYVTAKLGIRSPVVWVACPVACNIANKLKKSKLVYQRTDRYEQYPNTDARSVQIYDKIMKSKADLTLFVNTELYNLEAGQCKRALYLDHGVDFDLFASAENIKFIPEDMKFYSRPVIGYFGAMDSHTFDADFLCELADLLPEMTFVLIGKSSLDNSKLNLRSNIRMLGQKAYEQIPYYGKCFDVAIMPWMKNQWIEACNPIKLKEYLALGKPVVSRTFPELQKYNDVIYQTDNVRDFAKLIIEAVKHNNIWEVAARRNKVQQSTWENKAETVLGELFNTV
jgi:glycosyltransferase involved in cell wall biosynthesis